MEAKIKKRWISVLISAGLILSALWMLFLKPSNRLSSYVPDHASWYAETDHPLQLLKEIDRSIQPFSDSGLTLVHQMQSGASSLLSIFASRNELLARMKESTFGISAHALAGNEAGYVFYLASSPEDQNEILNFIETRFRNKKGFRFERRDYLGETVAEISEKGGPTLSVSFLKNAIIASYSGFLLEEVIRNSGVMLKPGFAAELSRDTRYRHLENKALRLFLNSATLPEFLKEFISNPETSLIRQTSEAMVLGLEGFSNMNLDFQGFVLGRKNGNSSGKILNNRLKAILPQGSEVLSFQFKINELWKSLAGNNKDDEAKIVLLQKALEDEILLALLEGQGLKKYDHILVTGIKSKPELDQILQQVAGSQSPPHLYQENYRGFVLYKHRKNQLAAEIGGKQLTAWTASCYAIFGSYLVVCDQMELLRQCADLQVEKYSTAQQDGMAAKFSLEASPGRLVPYFMENSAGPLRRRFREWLPLIKSIKRLRIYDHGESENPGISLTLSLKIPGAMQDSLQPMAKVFLDSGIVSNPVRFLNKAGEPVWVLQDIKKQAHFLDSKLNILASRPLPEFWVNEPQLMKRNGNSGNSILFSFPKCIQVFSESGEAETDFALQLSDSLAALSHTSLIDYDHSLQYRLFAASRYGYVIACDAGGRFLSGWNPKKLNIPLAQPPRHIRIAGRDYLLMLDKSGQLLLTSRKGEMQPGFPFKLKGDAFSSVFLETGLEEENSFVYCLSDLGQMEKVSLTGKQVSFLQLFRPDVNTRFLLCPDQNGKTFVVARQSPGNLTLFDQSYRPVLEYKSAGSRFAVRHFQFGSSNKIYAITNLDSGMSQLFNESGLPVLRSEFQSSGLVDILPSRPADGHYTLFSVFENRATLSEFQKD